METVKICSLASGSNGNAYYIEYKGEAVLVDIGISYRRLRNRAMTRNIDLSKVRHILISHEHSDHVYGLPVFCRHSTATPYMTHGTLRGLRPKYCPPQERISLFAAGDTLHLDAFTIYTFAKPHDVLEPCSFRIEAGGINIGVFTDIGAPCAGLEENLLLCNAAFLEANYDQEMLKQGSYTRQLKDRITNGHGHLSNVQSAQIIRALNPPHLHTILLSHISQENNRREIAKQEFDDIAQNRTIKVMSRMEASEVMIVSADQTTIEPQHYEIPERLDRRSPQLFP